MPKWSVEHTSVLRRGLVTGRDLADIANAVGRTRKACQMRAIQIGLRPYKTPQKERMKYVPEKCPHEIKMDLEARDHKFQSLLRQHHPHLELRDE